MKSIKLSGREQAVLRALETLGSTGAEVCERTQIDPADLADILNALCDVGYVEAYTSAGLPFALATFVAEQVPGMRFEINPSYALDLKKALLRNR